MIRVIGLGFGVVSVDPGVLDVGLYVASDDVVVISTFLQRLKKRSRWN